MRIKYVVPLFVFVIFVGYLSFDVFAEDRTVSETVTIEGYFNIGERIYEDRSYEFEYYLFSEDEDGNNVTYLLNFENVSMGTLVELSGRTVQIEASLNPEPQSFTRFIYVDDVLDVQKINGKPDISKKSERLVPTPKVFPVSNSAVVLPVRFNGLATEPHDLNYYNNLFFTGAESMTAYWNSHSFGAYTFAGSVQDWQELPLNRAGYTTAGGFFNDPLALIDAISVHDANVNFNNFDMVILVFNDSLEANSLFAFAFFNPQQITTAEGVKFVSLVFTPDKGDGFPLGINFEKGTGVTLHEMGHTFGLRHTMSPPPSTSPYDDEASLMSGGGPDGPPGFISIHKEIATWLPAADIVIIPEGEEQIVTLDILSSPSPGANYLMAKVPFGTGGEFYSVEARKDSTFDQTPLDQMGIWIYHWKPGGHGAVEADAPVILVNTGAAGDFDNADLDIGQIFVQNNVEFEALSLTTNPSITVRINNGGGCSLEPEAVNLAVAMNIPLNDILCASLNGSDTVGETVQNIAVTEFPTAGPDFAVISSGCAGDVLLPNDSESHSCTLGGLNNNEGTDMVQLFLRLDTPDNTTAVKFDWKFLSDEFPEFVGTSFNDAFLAELGDSNFTVSGTSVNAPNNIAFDANGNRISINTTGSNSMSAANAFGTTYDGATAKLTTIAPVTTSQIDITFSVFDVGDNIYDTTVFLDNFMFLTEEDPDNPVTTSNPGEIHGTVWSDDNANGTIDTGEEFLSGVSLDIFRLTPNTAAVTLVGSTLSASLTGAYEFLDLQPGFYEVQATAPPDKVQTFPANNNTWFVNVGENQIVNDINFGFDDSIPGSIDVTVFEDANGNGIFDGESGIAGIQVCLNNNFNCTPTDGAGLVSFTNLPSGPYDVSIILGDNMINTTPINQSVTVQSNLVSAVFFGIQSAPTAPPPEVTISGVISTYSGLPVTHWSNPLTITKDVGPNGSDHCGANMPVEIKVVGVFTQTGTVVEQLMTEGANEVWSATFPPFVPNNHGNLTFTFYVDCPPDTVGFPQDISLIDGEDEIQAGGSIYVDPSGTILDSCTNNPVTGVTATLLKESPPGSNNFVIPNTSDHIPSENPQTTTSDGTYGWVVTQGDWQVSTSHPDYIDNMTPVVTIPPAVTDLDVLIVPNIGCTTPNSVSGIVFADINSDGIQDSGEDGISGLTVILVEIGTGSVSTTITNSNGGYEFTGVVAGDLLVQVAPVPEDHLPSTGFNSFGFPTLVDENTLQQNFPMHPLTENEFATVNGRVFEDIDDNGIQGQGENGIENVQVFAVELLTQKQLTTTTGPNGFYFFENIIPDVILVQAAPIPAGHLPSTGLLTFTFPTLLSGLTTTFDIPLRTIDSSETGTITFDVFNDANSNGIKDTGEGGVEGAVVFTFELLTATADVQFTDANGASTHTGLIPDVVLAQINAVVLPEGFTTITTTNDVPGAEFVILTPGASVTVQIGLAP